MSTFPQFQLLVLALFPVFPLKTKNVENRTNNLQWNKNLWKNLSLIIQGKFSIAKKNAVGIFILKVPQTCKCDTNILEQPHNTIPGHCPLSHSALGAVSSSHTVWPQTERQTCNCSSPRPHNLAGTNFNILLYFVAMSLRKKKICI